MKTTAGATGGQTASGALRDRVAEAGRAGHRRLRTYLIVALQAGVAAALAWLVAREVLGNHGTDLRAGRGRRRDRRSLGNRAPRAVELVAGVVLGIGAGDLLISLFGTGPWQTGVIVFLATAAAVLVRGVGALMTQAGGTAVLVATLTPTAPDLELPRTINALVGGASGLFVVLVLPR